MNTTQTVVLMAHTVIAIVIIVLVLLQRGKGADAGAAFGAGASGTVFGSRGSSNFFSRATAVLATMFFASSLALAYLSSQEAERPESLIEGAPEIEFEDPAGTRGSDSADGVLEIPELDEPQGAGFDSSGMPSLDSAEPPESASDAEDDDRN